MKSVYGGIKKNCCGCSACLNACPQNAIKMISDNKGFSYPDIDKPRCIDCGMCQKVCPFVNYGKPLNPYNQVFAVKHKDISALMRSSSGGMFTALSDYVLQNNGSIYGCKYDPDFSLVHRRAVNKTDRDELCGSKYTQSDTSDCFAKVKEDLNNRLPVCFCGTPCQCAGLKSYLQNVDRAKLLLISLICHGVPSPLLFREYLNYCDKKRCAHTVYYEHRTKHKYWGHTERARFVYSSGDSNSDSDSPLSQAWKRLFYTGAALRDCCYSCPWAVDGHLSDITIGDFWGIEDCIPDFYDHMGVSLVLINTANGQYAFDAIADNVDVRETTFEDAVSKNRNLLIPSEPSTNMDIFWEIYFNQGFEALIQKYGCINPRRIP